MAENKASKAAGEAQEPPKKEKTYKVTCGTFKARNEALQRAAEAKRAGVHVSLKICKTEYSLRHTPTLHLQFLYCSETSAFTFFASIAFLAASASAFVISSA